MQKPDHEQSRKSPKRSGVRLQSEIHGKIKQVALAFEGEIKKDGGVRHRQIVEDFSPHFQLIIFPGFKKQKSESIRDGIRLGFELLPEHQTKTLDGDIVIDPLLDHEKNLRTALDLIKNPKLLNHSSWVQDAFLVLNDQEGNAIILQSFFAVRIGDWMMALQIAEDREADLSIRPTRYLIEGGNIIGAGRFAIAGKDSLAINTLAYLSRRGEAKLTPELLAELEGELCDLLGLDQILWLGADEPLTDPETGHSTFQPLYHLDLYFNLAGYFPTADKQGKQLVIMLGQPVSMQEYGIEDAPPVPEFYVQAIENTASQLHSTLFQNFLPKFKLIRVPLPYYKGPETQFSTTWFSFNNCHVEFGPEGRAAFLPNYVSQGGGPLDKALEKVQKEVAAIYSEIGFEQVFWIGEGIYMQHFARKLGSLRCLTKVIRRDYS